MRGGVLLGLSAIGSKLFGLWRDRLFIEIFGAGEKTDLIFASFRIPDFFFFLLVGATASALILPRISHLDAKEEKQFISSFLWGVVLIFGIFCGIGTLFAPLLIPVFASGFSLELQTEMTPLVRLLFGSVFILAISATFSAFHQHKHKFLYVALAPFMYTSGICLGLFLLRDKFGIITVGFAALLGSLLHLLMNGGNFFRIGGRIVLNWKKPDLAWKNFKGDFVRRVLNNSAFQVNQTADVIIASFLATGSVMAFSLGSNFGHFLLSVVGYSSANSAFPHLTKAKNNFVEQKKILKERLRWILFFSIPTAVFCGVFSVVILHLVFGLDGSALEITATVFFWTVISLPGACVIPLLSRFFLANDDTVTPLWINSISLMIATILAAVLSLWIFPSEIAILGLALGNFTANYLSAGLFGLALWHRLCK